MRLFDEVIRSDNNPRERQEPYFKFLNRTSRPAFYMIRGVLEEWYSHYPLDGQYELYSRFRDYNNINHLSALFELYLHEMLLKLECQVTLHPLPNVDIGKRPDFLVKTKEGEQFYLEAIVASDMPRLAAAAEARKNRLKAEIDRRLAASLFWIGWKIQEAPSTPAPVKKIVAYLRNHMPNMEHNKVATSGFSSWPRSTFIDAGWVIDFWFIPKPVHKHNQPASRSIIMEYTRAQHVQPEVAIREAVVNKGKRYGDLELPYVVAVNGLSDDASITAFEEALFGHEKTTIWNDANGNKKTCDSRILNGAWVSGSGPRYTRVSAVLAIHRLQVWSLTTALVHLYCNPWAALPLPSVLDCLPHMVIEDTSITYQDGRSLCDIFGLPDEWPGDFAQKYDAPMTDIQEASSL